MLPKFKRILYDFYSKYFTFSTLVSGTLKGDDKVVRVLLTMDRNSPFENYLLGLIFGDRWEKVWVRRLWIPLARRYSTKLPDGASFCIAQFSSRWKSVFSACSALTSPSIVRQSVSLHGDWGEIKKCFNETRRSEFNQLYKSNRFSYRIASLESGLNMFHGKMYLPHILRQFGPAARNETLQEFRARFPDGFLLFVCDGATDVAGALCTIEGTTLYYQRAGVLGGDELHVRNGAQTAMYIFLMQYAKSRNLLHLDLGHSRPFIANGVFKHKRSWGANVSIDADLDRWFFYFNPKNTEAGRLFLRLNPLLVQTNDGMAACAMMADSEQAEASTKAMRRQFYSPGVSGLLITSSDGITMHRMQFSEKNTA